MSSEKAVRGIQSIEVLGEILSSLDSIKIPASLRQLSIVTGMSQAKLYPYLVSMQRSNMIKRSDSGEYSIGELFKELGYLGLHLYKPAIEANYAVRELGEYTGHAVICSTWGTLGPTILQFHNARFELYTELRNGSVMSLPNSSIGLTFAAFMPVNIIRDALKHDHLRNRGQKLSENDEQKFWEEVGLIKSKGYHLLDNSPLDGLSAVSAPVFGVNQNVELVITLIDKTPYLRKDDDSALKSLLDMTSRLSKNLGFEAIADGL